ncbi:hypothetical protein KHQ81_11705 [Mycoplasmatota bacterium]|nr:hypothetical protein KHQ81_11705 [Mycoplasmatota bacterium]
MRKLIAHYIYVLIASIPLSILYAFINKLKIFNPIFIVTIITLIIICVLFIYISVNLAKKIPSYSLGKYRNKLYFCFILLSLLPLASNIYLDLRVYKINSMNDFFKIEWNPGGNYYLGNDIDFNDFTTTKGYVIPEFTGTLDGNDKTINNLRYPLFYKVKDTRDNSGIVKNLNLRNVNIKIEDRRFAAGAVALQNWGTIINVHAIGEVEGIEKVGGLVGINNSVIEQSSFKGIVRGKYFTGGIAGINHVNIRTSYTEAKVNGVDIVGGIAGSNDVGGVVENCYTIEDVKGEKMVGGIAGTSSGSISSSFVIGNIIGREIVGVLSFDEVNNKGFISGKIISNNYHFEDNIFYINPSISDIPNDKIITPASMTKDWFINELGLVELNWDFTPLIRNEYPILKEVPNQQSIIIS